MHKEDEIWVTFVVMIIPLVLSVALLIFFLSYKRKFNYLKEKQQLRNDFNQELLRAQLEIQEQTFQNISQEIHDNIGQTLSLAKLNLNTLDIKDNADCEQKILITKELVGKAIIDLRSLSKSMNTDTIVSAGLLKAIEYELGLINKSGSIHAAMETSGTPTRLDARKELILFRIVQESLNNIIKHSGAMNIKVTATFESSHLELLVEDDGKGFDAGIVTNEMESGSGLRNMKSRATIIGGNLEINSNKGTQIKITIPTNEA